MNESDRIYDRPKVPAMKYEVDSSRGRQGVEDSVRSQQQGLYENFVLEEKQHEDKGYNDLQVLYDVPKSNKRVVTEEAIYVNDEAAAENDPKRLGYDVPRMQNLSDLALPQDYDVPKIRDSLSTIEEDQEYDVPRSSAASLIVPPHKFSSNSTAEADEEKADVSGRSKYAVPKSSPSTTIYANDRSSYCSDFTTTNSNDDRSSGYRSSSSPSIQSEELYVNESAIASMEDLDSCGSSHKHSSPEPTVRDIAIETTLEKKKEKKKKPTVDKEQAKELARERERQKAEEIEKDIRKRREENQAQKSSAISQYFDNRSGNVQNAFGSSVTFKDLTNTSASIPKFDVPNDDFVTIGEIAGGEGDPEEDELAEVPKAAKESPKKSSFASNFINKFAPAKPAPVYFSPTTTATSPTTTTTATATTSAVRSQATNAKKPQLQNFAEFPTKTEHDEENVTTSFAPKMAVFNSNNGNNSQNVNNTVEKKQQQKDRSVDVYHETIRQRLSRTTEAPKLSKDVFKTNETGKGSTLKKTKAQAPPPPPPSARPSEPEGHHQHDEDDMPSVRQLRSKFETRRHSPPRTVEVAANTKKSGFLVMSSLTRRGAVNMSRSLHNLSGAMKAAMTLSTSNGAISEVPPAESDKDVSHVRGMVDNQSLFASKELRFGASGFARSRMQKNNETPINNSSKSPTAKAATAATPATTAAAMAAAAAATEANGKGALVRLKSHFPTTNFLLCRFYRQAFARGRSRVRTTRPRQTMSRRQSHRRKRALAPRSLRSAHVRPAHAKRRRGRHSLGGCGAQGGNFRAITAGQKEVHVMEQLEEALFRGRARYLAELRRSVQVRASGKNRALRRQCDGSGGQHLGRGGQGWALHGTQMSWRRRSSNAMGKSHKCGN